MYPSKNEQNIVSNIIVELLNDTDNNLQREKLENICNALYERGAEIILLACTDLQLIMSNMQTSVPVVDTTEILINASVREIIKS